LFFKKVLALEELGLVKLAYLLFEHGFFYSFFGKLLRLQLKLDHFLGVLANQFV
jgi:hypothetical protein